MHVMEGRGRRREEGTEGRMKWSPIKLGTSYAYGALTCECSLTTIAIASTSVSSICMSPVAATCQNNNACLVRGDDTEPMEHDLDLFTSMSMSSCVNACKHMPACLHAPPATDTKHYGTHETHRTSS
jgi:hypothetical protein